MHTLRWPGDGTGAADRAATGRPSPSAQRDHAGQARSEEHTSELQSLRHLVCRLLLEKKKKEKKYTAAHTSWCTRTTITIVSEAYRRHITPPPALTHPKVPI